MTEMSYALCMRPQMQQPYGQKTSTAASECVADVAYNLHLLLNLLASPVM